MDTNINPLDGSNKQGRKFLNKLKLGNISNELILFIVLIILVMILGISNDKFLTFDNIINVARQMSYIGIMSLGMAFVIIAAGIDLSIGSISALAGAMFGVSCAELQLPWIIAIALALIGGCIVGAINGLASNQLRIPAFIVTLGTMSIFRGVVMIWTGGQPISPFNDNFLNLGAGYLLSIPIPTIIFAVLFVFAFLVLEKTKFGRYVYAMGGNAEAARIAGINVKLVGSITFIICGFTAAIAGLIMTARLNSAAPTIGIGSEMDAIAAVCVGGISLYGGKGTIIGMLIGAAIMSVIRNGLNLLDVSTWWQSVIVGCILISAVFFSSRK